jgi:hypothetical protein
LLFHDNTAWDNPVTGHSSILEFHQGLWFGPTLPNSLINPNQSRVFGISICDDPFDPHRQLEMYDTETGTTVPLSMCGSTCHFISRVPTKLELDTLPRVVMTSDELWDPASLFWKQRSSEEEEHTRLMSSVKINQDTIQCNPNEPQSESDESETDRLLVGISSSLTLESMLPRILSSIRVATYLPDNPQGDDTRAVSSLGSKTRHSVVTAEERSRKWRVGINTARQTLKATTQRGIRTAVHPLTRR